MTLDASTESPSSSAMTEPVVVVREPGRVALRLVLTEPLEFGRDCAGVLLADPQMSRRHLELRPEGGGVVATDLGSTNGTAIDGRPLNAPTVLTPGAVCTAGSTTIEVLPTGGEVPDPRATMITSGDGGTSEPQVDLRRTSIDIVVDSVTEAKPDLSVAADQGTISIVFSDIESSTERASDLGDERWFEVLGHHNRIVRAELERFQGTEIKNQGDGFMLTFPSARRAVLCMSAIQQELARFGAEHPEDAIRVRVGIHTGEAIADEDGDLFGRHVIMAARIANEARGEEILVSSLVKEIISTRGDVEFGKPRSAELKGLGGIQTMHPVLWR